MKILICGGNGSIGKKHLENLRILGETDVDICDKTGGKYTDIYEIQNANQYDLVIIAAPPDTHIEFIHFFNDRQCKYIMCEKPLCLLPTGNQLLLEEKGQIVIKELTAQVFVNNAYRFERGINKLKECFPLIGSLRHATLENSYSFAKLHPYYEWGDFDGIIYDDSHIINTSRFCFGSPVKILHKHLTKQLAEFTWETENRAIISHRTDLLSETFKKRIEVKGTLGTLVYNYGAHEIFFSPADESPRRAIPYEFASHLFESLKYVLEVVKKGGEFEENTIFDAWCDMAVIQRLLE